MKSKTTKILYIIQVRKWNRWVMTIWTGHIPTTRNSKPFAVEDDRGRKLNFTGKPVPMRTAKKALARAQKWFPKSEFRIREKAAQ